jgi:catechol 2,3-dioxygenase-like lactoylglutathione lyase family enzyme
MQIEKLILLTNDIAATKNFYAQKLELPVLEDGEDFVAFPVGSSILQFNKTSIANAVYHFAFNIPSNKINHAIDWCRRKALKLLPYQEKELVDFPNWNSHSIYFLDNNGSILEFIARHDLNNAAADDFGSKHLLCISEIGVVTTDVIEFCNKAEKEYAIPYYEKQNPAPDFSVMGDAEGLFIVVPEKRKWFPTTITSTIFPLEVTIKQAGNDYSLSLP